MPEYLSTDPDAGLDGYLSTDPDAGEDAPSSRHNPSSPVSPGVAVGGAMAAAPAAVSFFNRLAGVAGKVAAGRAAGIVPAAIALDAGADVLRGDPKAAAGKAAAATAASQAPRVIRAVQAATSPARTVAGGASTILNASGAPYRAAAVTTAAGPLARAAGAVSKFAGPAGLVLDAVTQPGHRPTGETSAITSARQSAFAAQFRDQINKEAGYEVIPANATTSEIIDAIARRGAR